MKHKHKENKIDKDQDLDEGPKKNETDDTYVSKKVLNQDSRKDQIEKQQNYKPRDNA